MLRASCPPGVEPGFRPTFRSLLRAPLTYGSGSTKKRRPWDEGSGAPRVARRGQRMKRQEPKTSCRYESQGHFLVTEWLKGVSALSGSRGMPRPPPFYWTICCLLQSIFPTHVITPCNPHISLPPALVSSSEVSVALEDAIKKFYLTPMLLC